MKRMRKPKLSPLVYPASVLSAASLAWTTWSLVDLIGTGLIGVTVAAGADVVWGAVILAEARGLRIAGKRWAVPTVGWAALLAVAGLLAWHGLAAGIPAMAVAGPLLPLGGKIVWVLALADMRDPAALTDDEMHQLAEIERSMAFDEARHRITMRRREMDAELQMAELGVDFDIELMRQDKARELTRRRPLELPAGGEQPVPEYTEYARVRRTPDPAETAAGVTPARGSVTPDHQLVTGTDGPYPALPEGVPAAYPAADQLRSDVKDDIATHPADLPEPSKRLAGHLAVLAAEAPRTRPGVHAEYVPDLDDEPDDDSPPPPAEDTLTARARADFLQHLVDGTAPSIRTLKDRYAIGQKRAQRIRAELEKGIAS